MLISPETPDTNGPQQWEFYTLRTFDGHVTGPGPLGNKSIAEALQELYNEGFELVTQNQDTTHGAMMTIRQGEFILKRPLVPGRPTRKEIDNADLHAYVKRLNKGWCCGCGVLPILLGWTALLLPVIILLHRST